MSAEQTVGEIAIELAKAIGPRAWVTKTNPDHFADAMLELASALMQRRRRPLIWQPTGHEYGYCVLLDDGRFNAIVNAAGDETATGPMYPFAACLAAAETIRARQRKAAGL